MRENTQTARSHDLYTKLVPSQSYWTQADISHPIEDSQVALIKGAILLNKVNKFVRYVKAAEPSERPFLKETPEFVQLDEDIKTFVYVLSPFLFVFISLTRRKLMTSRYFPVSLRDPLKHLTGMHKGIDADLIVSLPLLSHLQF
jgi:hypothetical protein